MLKVFFWTLSVAVLLATSAFSHPKPEAHVCGIDPDTLTGWPGYGTVGPVYDRGTNFFSVERIAEGVIHHRLFKEDCSTSSIVIAYSSGSPEASSGSGFWGLTVQRFYYNSVEGDWNTTTQRTFINQAGEITEQTQVESKLTPINGLPQWVEYQTTDYVTGTISLTDGTPDIAFDNTVSRMIDPTQGGWTPLTTLVQDYSTGATVETTRHNHYPPGMMDSFGGP